MAADANGSGSVTSADALAIARMAVGLNTGPQQEWFFVEETRDFWDESSGSFNLTQKSAVWDKGMPLHLVQNEVNNLVGVLKGDVNGSWIAPVGSADLDVTDPTYFMNLATLIGAPVEQWGG
jgi:hypothetical protein